MATPPVAESCSNCTNYINSACHVNPPQAVAFNGARQAAGGYHVENYTALNLVWPQTDPTDWCAQWDK